MYCKDCKESLFRCICKKVDEFFKSVKDFPRKEVQKRCLACWFMDCRCKKGLDNK